MGDDILKIDVKGYRYTYPTVRREKAPYAATDRGAALLCTRWQERRYGHGETRSGDPGYARRVASFSTRAREQRSETSKEIRMFKAPQLMLLFFFLSTRRVYDKAS